MAKGDITGGTFILANKDAKGKAIAIYTCAPNLILGMAELLLLKEKALPKNPGKKIMGYLDTDPSISPDDFMSSYQQEDKDRFWAFVREIVTTGTGNK